MACGLSPVSPHHALCSRHHIEVRMSDDIIIDVKNVWKRYGLPPLLPWKRHALREEDCALTDISFQVRRGGSLGILGRNGAGKSTLLKLLAGVTPPDKGSIDIRGSIFPMIELNAGISMELSGRENIQLLATIMGFNDKAIRRLEPEVVDFSELEGWIDKPVWQYSSGMLARLAFGIAVHARADILLVDEVLSTGDIMFQKKCQEKVQQMLSSGTTFLFVSHSPYQVERLCEHGLLLSHGKSIRWGDALQVVKQYLQDIRSKNAKNPTVSSQNILRPGTGDIRVEKVSFCDRKNNELIQIISGSDVNIKVDYIAYNSIENAYFQIRILDEYQRIITTLSPKFGEYKSIIINKGRGSIIYAIKNFPLCGECFWISVKCTAGYLVDMAENIREFSVDGSNDMDENIATAGIISLNYKYMTD